MKLDIYKIIDGTDDWPLITTIEADTKEECQEIAERDYGPDECHHWTNCYD